jgi:hypothetical protein
LINLLPVSWPLQEGSIGDRYEGPQVANRIHRTASTGRSPDRDRQPLDRYFDAELQRPVYRQVVTGPDLKPLSTVSLAASHLVLLPVGDSLRKP